MAARGRRPSNQAIAGVPRDHGFLPLHRGTPTGRSREHPCASLGRVVREPNRTVTALCITGIGGFIGARLAERAGILGWPVTGLDASPAAAERARKLGATVEIGSVDDPAAVSRAVRGAEAVVHTAAIVRESGALEQFRRINVRGSLLVARAARDAGAHAFVHLSSVMVYGFRYPDRVDEDGPRRGEGNPYCQTKIESEDAVLPLNDPARFAVALVRPGDVYGPGSVPWVQRPLAMMRRRLFALPARGAGIMNHVHVDNLIDAIVRCIEKRPAGRAFNVTDGRATTNDEYFSRLAAAAGLPPPRHAPAALMMGAGTVVSALRRLGLTRQELAADSVRYLLRPFAYSNERARRELGWEPRVSLEQGMAELRDSLAG